MSLQKSRSSAPTTESQTIAQQISTPSTAHFLEPIDSTKEVDQYILSSVLSKSPKPILPFVLGVAEFQDTSEDPFSDLSSLSNSNSPSTFTVRVNLHCRRGWPLANLTKDFEYISRFPSFRPQPPSPTHKPKRAQISMNHREGPNLPSGNRLATMAHPPPPSQIPQYLSGDQFNTSSTDSQDSFTTQVPHSFHSAASDGNFAVQDQKQQNNAYVSAFVGSNVPFATPQIVSNSAFLSLRSMNPNSAEFKPVGPPSNNGSNNSTEPASFNTSFESNASSGYQSSMGSGFQTQIGDTSYYGTPTPYGNISVAGNTGAQYIDDYGIVVNPRLESYGPYPAATTSGNFDAYNPHSGTQAYTAQSPAMGYYNGNTSYQGAAYGGIHPSGYQNGQVTQYNSHSNQYVAQPIYHNPANANRGKPINTRGNSNLRAHNQRSSNLATAPVMNPLHQGGPVHPPSTSHGPPSPSKSRASDCSTLTSEVKSEFETSTPAQVTRHLEFRSEPHGAKTPTQLLRSRRGQNISTDRKPNTGIWLDGIPSAGVIPSESQMLRGSPPKMGSLSLVGPLTPIGPDPFVSSTPGFKRPFNNPFCQTPQQLSPFNGSNASGHQNNGPSAALMSLTAGCTRKPTLGEAMNSKNLPFAEYCRLAKEDSWGVIRIKNVSACNISTGNNYS